MVYQDRRRGGREGEGARLAAGEKDVRIKNQPDLQKAGLLV